MKTDERFWAKVKKSDGCWLWIGATFHGYGHFRRGSSDFLAHRVVLEESLGRPLGTGEQAMHRCDVRLCVRPDHLLPGTNRDNAIDMCRKGRRPHSKLSADDVIEIRRRLKDGESHSGIARVFSVDRSSISLIAEGKRWEWLDG